MRRVVAGAGDGGRSVIVADSAPTVLYHFRDQAGPHDARAERVPAVPDSLAPGEGVLAELWRTDDPPRRGMSDPLAATGEWAVECPPAGTRFRTSLFSAGRTTAMHTTDTLDYDFVLAGEITLMLSDGSETLLRAGDAVVIPGVAHAWRAGPGGARLGLVMVGLDRPGPGKG